MDIRRSNFTISHRFIGEIYPNFDAFNVLFYRGMDEFITEFH